MTSFGLRQLGPDFIAKSCLKREKANERQNELGTSSTLSTKRQAKRRSNMY